MTEPLRVLDIAELHKARKLPDDPFSGGTVVANSPVLVSMRDAVGDAIRYTTADRKDRFISTAIKSVDERFSGGLEKGTMTIVGGYTSSGKSTFALGMLDDFVAAGKQALIISLEDSHVLYGRRLLSMRTGLKASILRRGGLSSEQLGRIQNAFKKVPSVPFFMNARGWKVEHIGTALKWVQDHYPVELVVVDYLQKLDTQESLGTKAATLEKAAHYLSDLMCNLGMVGVMLSQLTGARDEVPTEANIRDCKSISNAAENVLLLWRNETDYDFPLNKRGYNLSLRAGKTALLTAKMKDGGNVGADMLHFDENRQRYVDPIDEYQEHYDGFEGEFA